MTKLKHVIITGGGSGLGRAMAIAWAEEGAKVCIADINDTAAKEVCGVIRKSGGNAIAIRCDVTKSESIKNMHDELLSNWGKVDLVINNAGVATADRFETETLEQWQWAIDLNLLSIVRVSQAFTPTFKKQKHGYFLNVSSQAGITPIPFMSSYNATKSAVVGLSETMHLELEDNGIGVSVLCPGFFKTNLAASMKSSLPGLKAITERIFEKSDVTAEQVAKIAYQGVERNKFLILSHKAGRKAFRFKRMLPMNSYLKMVGKQTQKFRDKVNSL